MHLVSNQMDGELSQYLALISQPTIDRFRNLAR